jgi:hypothetical protein
VFTLHTREKYKRSFKEVSAQSPRKEFKKGVRPLDMYSQKKKSGGVREE